MDGSAGIEATSFDGGRGMDPISSACTVSSPEASAAVAESLPPSDPATTITATIAMTTTKTTDPSATHSQVRPEDPVGVGPPGAGGAGHG